MVNTTVQHLTRRALLTLAGLLLLAQSVVILSPWYGKWTTATWLRHHLAPYTHIIADLRGQEVQQLTLNWNGASTWTWTFQPAVERKSPLAWLGEGAHYLLIDERTFVDEDFQARINGLVSRGATLLYVSSPIIPFYSPRQAVLWAFHPDHELNAVFDDRLQLVGYNVYRNQAGQINLLLHWYTLNPPAIDYHMFLHIIDPATATLAGQADTVLGKGTHPTTTWTQNEIVFESVALPAEALQKFRPPYHLRIGLYDLSSGQRAQVQGHDAVEVEIAP